MSNERSPLEDCSTTIGTSCIASRMGELQSARMWGERAGSGGAHAHQGVAVCSGLRHPLQPRAIELMDDPQDRSAVPVRGDTERDGAFEKRRAVFAHRVSNFLAGRDGRRRAIDQRIPRQPGFAKLGNADGLPDLLGWRVEVVFELNAARGLLDLFRVHWSISFSKTLRASMRAGQ